MKRLIGALGLVVGIATFAYAASGPAGQFILNVSSNNANPAFSVSSGTVKGNLTLSAINFNNCLQTNPQGVVVGTGQPCSPQGGNNILNQSTLQSGATFYVTSGTVQGQFTAGTINVQYGISTATMTVTTMTVTSLTASTGTYTGEIILKDGTLITSTSTFGAAGSAILVSTQTFSGANNFTSPTNSTFTYGLVMGSGTVNGPGNGQIALTIGVGGNVPSTYTVTVSSVVPTTNHFAVWTSTSGTLGDSVGSSGGGTPAGPTNAVQYNNGGSFGGSNGFEYNGASTTVVSSMVVTSVAGLGNNPASFNGFLDVYHNTAFSGQTLFSVGSNNTSHQFFVQDQKPVNAAAFGLLAGALQLGETSPGSQIISNNNIGINQQIDLGTTGGTINIQTDAVGNGGGVINLSPNKTIEVNISSYGVVASTGVAVNPGFFQLYSRTIAQIGAITPTPTVTGGSVLGEMYYCNNCANTAVCVSTGSAQGAFSRASSLTGACN